MKYGLVFVNTMHWAKGPGAIDMARSAEDAGFESLWTVEHVVYPDDYSSPYPYSADGKMPAQPSTPIPDPLIWLAYVASVTTAIRLATGILILPQRNPVVLAKELATLDQMSGGRVELGIGVGWLREGVRSARRAVGATRRAHRRVRRGHARAVGLRRCELRRRVRFVHPRVVEPEARAGPDPDRDRRPLTPRRANAPAGSATASSPARAPAELREMIDIVRQTAADHGRDPEAIEVTAGSPRSSETTRSAQPRSSPRSGSAASSSRRSCCGSHRSPRRCRPSPSG